MSVNQVSCTTAQMWHTNLVIISTFFRNHLRHSSNVGRENVLQGCLSLALRLLFFQLVQFWRFFQKNVKELIKKIIMNLVLNRAYCDVAVHPPHRCKDIKASIPTFRNSVTSCSASLVQSSFAWQKLGPCFATRTTLFCLFPPIFGLSVLFHSWKPLIGRALKTSRPSWIS